MRKFLTWCLPVAVFLSAGCMMGGKKDDYYCKWEFGKLPIVRTETPILVNTSGQVHEAQALGTAAGPIQQGQFVQGRPGVSAVPFLMQPRADAYCNTPCPPPVRTRLPDPCEVNGQGTAPARPMPPAQ